MFIIEFITDARCKHEDRTAGVQLRLVGLQCARCARAALTQALPATQPLDHKAVMAAVQSNARAPEVEV